MKVFPTKFAKEIARQLEEQRKLQIVFSSSVNDFSTVERSSIVKRTPNVSIEIEVRQGGKLATCHSATVRDHSFAILAIRWQPVVAARRR